MSAAIADPAKVIPLLKQLHVGSVRVWFIKGGSWSPSGGERGLEVAAAYHAAGFRVTEVSGSPHTRGRFFGGESRRLRLRSRRFLAARRALLQLFKVKLG